VVFHAVLIVVSNLAAFWLRFDGNTPTDHWQHAVQLLPYLLATRVLTFVPFRLFEGLWRYSSLWDLRNIILGVFASTMLFYPLAAILANDPSYPRSIYIIDSLLLIMLLGGFRMSRRIYREMTMPHKTHRVLIFGAGDAGEMIVRDMRQNKTFDAVPVGFVDDDARKTGQRIHGVPVLGTRERIESILADTQAQEVLIAMPGATREVLRTLIRQLEPYKLKISTLPRLSDLVGIRIGVDLIRQLRVEDLLAREPVGLSFAPVIECLRGKRIIITGAGGSIGSELCRQVFSASPSSLVMLDRYENGLFQIHQELGSAVSGLKPLPVVADITDRSRINQLFAELRPQIVFHAAAHKHVPLMEANPCEAVKNNVIGTRSVLEAAFQHGVEKFVLISTDKAVNPTSVMGASKRVAEMLVERVHSLQPGKAISVRFGNVLGSNGSVVPTFVNQIARGGPVTVTHPEMRRYFMLIPEAVQLVLHAATLDDDGPMFVLEMGDQVKVADLARDLIRLSGLVPDKDIEVLFTGIRPGEKLFEELVGPNEVSEASALDKIRKVKRKSGLSPDPFSGSLALLEEMAIAGRSDDVQSILRTLIAEFPSTSDTRYAS